MPHSLTAENRSQANASNYNWSEKASYKNHKFSSNASRTKNKTSNSSWTTTCLWITIVLFIFLVIIVVIVLIVLFTVGDRISSTYNVESNPTQDQIDAARRAFQSIDPEKFVVAASAVSIAEKPASSSSSGNKKHVLNSLIGLSHFDLNVPSFVLDALKSAPDSDQHKTLFILDAAFQLGDPAASRQKFLQGRLPAAGHFDINRIFRVPNGTAGGGLSQQVLPHPLVFQEYCRSLGINGNSHVIVYDRAWNDSETGSIATATFVWWLFKLYGHNKITVMNGGIDAWRQYTTNDPEYALVSGEDKRQVIRGNFMASWKADLLINRRELIKKMQQQPKTSTLILVDTRSNDQFNLQSSVIGSNALNFPLFPNFVSNNGASVKTFQDIRNFLASQKADDPQATFVTYDNDPVQASLITFVLNQLGLDTMLYFGGLSDWHRNG